MTDRNGRHARGDPGNPLQGADTDPIRRSVEVEYWVIDETGELTDPGDLVDAAPGIEREFIVPLLEIKTTPCETTEELREVLFDRIDRVLRRADDRGLGLVPLATPLAADEIRDRPSERTRIQDRVGGERFEYVRHCAGTHIHFEQQPGLEIEQLNLLTALDPALALVNSSPYFDGEYLAAGARSLLYRRMAYSALPHQGELWPYAEDTESWAERLGRRYREFKTAAVVAGINPETVDSVFEPEGAVWTPVKLRQEFSTVEGRSPDTALPSQVIRLIDDIAGIVERLRDTDVRIEGDAGHVREDTLVLPEFDTVEEYVDKAISEGLSSDAVRAYLDRMGFDVDAYEPLSHQINTGEELSTGEVQQLRLSCADRLKTDLEEARAISAD